MTRRRAGGRRRQVIPFELFTLVLCLIASVPLLTGAAPKPGSINSALDPAWATVWCAALAVGSVLAILGILWPWREYDGIVAEQIGLIITGGATLVYAYALFTAAQHPDQLVFVLALVGGFGVCSVWRAVQLGRSLRQKVEQHIAAAASDERDDRT